MSIWLVAAWRTSWWALAGAWDDSAVRHTGLGTTEFAEEGAVEAAGGWHCSQWKGNGVEGAEGAGAGASAGAGAGAGAGGGTSGC